VEEQVRPDPNQQLSAMQASRVIGVTRQGINKLIRDGRLKASLVEAPGPYYYYVIRRGDLDHYVANRRNGWGQLPPDYISSLE